MAQHMAANSAADTGDLISNAVVSPEASLFVRQILQSALAASARGAPPPWAAEASALLANVLMNDYLNWWNKAGPSELAAAQTAVNQAGNHPLAYHAQGLICRAQKQHHDAMRAFRTAGHLDYGFARGHAQFGNQKVLLGRESEAYAPLDRAMKLSPRHPASGYFYWGEGRAYFQETLWYNAINWLKMSVDALPTVWYNRCYLAPAQDSAGDAENKACARQTMHDFLKLFRKSGLGRAVTALTPNSSDPVTVAAARKRVHDFLAQF